MKKTSQFSSSFSFLPRTRLFWVLEFISILRFPYFHLYWVCACFLVRSSVTHDPLFLWELNYRLLLATTQKVQVAWRCVETQQWLLCEAEMLLMPVGSYWPPLPSTTLHASSRPTACMVSPWALPESQEGWPRTCFGLGKPPWVGAAPSEWPPPAHYNDVHLSYH